MIAPRHISIYLSGMAIGTLAMRIGEGDTGSIIALILVAISAVIAIVYWTGDP